MNAWNLHSSIHVMKDQLPCCWWNSEQDKSRPVHGMLNPLAPE